MRTLLALLCLAGLTGCPRLLYLDVDRTHRVRCLVLEVQLSTEPSTAWEECMAAVQRLWDDAP